MIVVVVNEHVDSAKRRPKQAKLSCILATRDLFKLLPKALFCSANASFAIFAILDGQATDAEFLENFWFWQTRVSADTIGGWSCITLFQSSQLVTIGSEQWSKGT